MWYPCRSEFIELKRTSLKTEGTTYHPILEHIRNKSHVVNKTKITATKKC